MKRKQTHAKVGNPALNQAMQEKRRSNAAGKHDPRPNRLRTRGTAKFRAIEEQR